MHAPASHDRAPFIWGMLLHMGITMWSDTPVTEWGNLDPIHAHLLSPADHLRFDEEVWQRITARMAAGGLNTLIIDLGEAVRYASHPELAVKGSWEPERLRRELQRLRSLGLEPLPKLNFSAAHDAWLQDYGRQLSTPVYYQVCADLIAEVCDIFDRPRLFHLGFDEETHNHQRKYAFSAVRQGELWWHDFNFMVARVEEQGVRPWIWSDYIWHNYTEFSHRMSHNVLQSNWFYGAALDGEAAESAPVTAYRQLEELGYDQVPTGSNWANDSNFAKTVEHCRTVIAPERLRGFIAAPWFFTLPPFEERLAAAVDQVSTVIKSQAETKPLERP